MTLTLPLCTLLMEVAEAKACAMGVAMVIALADDRGEMLTFARMDGALPASTEIATAKAYTAASLRMSTAQVGALSQPGQMLHGIQGSMQRPIVTFGGGLPLILKEKVIGAVGISGGQVEEDMTVADTVRAAFQAMKDIRSVAAAVVSPGMHWSTASVQGLRSIFRTQLPQLGEADIRVLTGAVLLV